ncbi:MAG: flagellar protein FlgN [Phycisphaeraceae bacterium]|nr:flagellar protein FlgN [Phycisphaeraceae bacterium]MBX3366729.1 flagellar protein FlgN [Phycisphaeraceae bacterium]
MSQRRAHKENTNSTLGSQLESLLHALIAAHHRLGEAVEAHRVAISLAHSEGIRIAIDEQTEALTQIADLERARAALVGNGQPRTITELAADLPEPDRSRIITLASDLRTLIGELRSKQAVVRSATRSLLSHTQGLMAQVGAALSHAGTYGRAGKVQSTTPACAALDLST